MPFPTYSNNINGENSMKPDGQRPSSATDEAENLDQLYGSIYTPAPTLASSRYSRQLLIPSLGLNGQRHISSAKVLIIGLGGLGSPAALYLAGAGVGVLGLLDDDVVEISNLHRQIVHREDSVRSGLGKVESAARGCRELNREIEIREHKMRLGYPGDEVLEVLGQYDIVLDCTDNPATRYLISDACVILGKTLVSGAAQKLEGQLMVLNYLYPHAANSTAPHSENPDSEAKESRYEKGPCYRCVFPRPPAREIVKSCGEIGILGPVVGTIGCLMASEALRLLVKGCHEPRKPSMLLYNAWPADPKSIFRTVGLRGRRKDCVACGDEEIVKEKGLKMIDEESVRAGSIDYVAFCGTTQDVKVLPKNERVAAADFLEQLRAEPEGATQTIKVIDVREPYEVELGPKIKNSINIPLPKILRGQFMPINKSSETSTTKDELEAIMEDEDVKTVLFVCPQGNDSQLAVQKVLQLFRGTPKNQNRFIGDITGGFQAIERVVKSGKDYKGR